MAFERRTFGILQATVFLTSFSLIGFEIALTRLLSVLLSYHYVFVVISMALLGLGFGGLFLHLFRSRTTKKQEEFGRLFFAALFFSLAIPFSVFSLLYLGSLTQTVPFYCLFTFLPFFLGGVFFAEIYRAFPSLSGRMYGLDLIGSGAGSLGALFFLNHLGGIHVNFLLSLIASISALCLAGIRIEKTWKKIIIALASLGISSFFLILSATGVYQFEIPIGANPTKEIHDALSPVSKGKIIETRWSAFGRTDLVDFGHDFGFRDLYLDGTAGSPMYQFNGNLLDPDLEIKDLKQTFPGYFPFLHLQNDERGHALIIGPGGGRDLLLALMGGLQKITAVEVNPDLVEIVRGHSTYNGGIYTRWPNVQIVVEEGRHFLKRKHQQYDVIMLSLPVTNTSRSLEGYSLTENFLFTVESMIDYFDHLTEKGSLIVVAHNDAEILRLLSLSLCALQIRGMEVQSAMKHIYITASKGSDNYLVFVLRKRPFGLEESLLRFKSMEQLGFDPTSSYFPNIGEKGGLNPALVSLSEREITLQQLWDRVGEKGYDITPVTDNSPFFYKIERGIPKSVAFIFWSSLVLLLLTMGVPFLYLRSYPKEQPQKGKIFSRFPFLKSIVLFSLIGIAFMLIEISLIQKLALFLGHPVLSLATLLFSLLGWAGIGSLWSSRLTTKTIVRGISLLSLFLALLILIYVLIVPILFERFLRSDFEIRFLVSILMLGPLGFLMGCPFPLGIRMLREIGRNDTIPWMWGINGVCSVWGASLTLVIAIGLGFTEALLISAGCYFILFMIFLRP